MSDERLRADFESYLSGGEPEAVELSMAPILRQWDVCVTREANGERCMTLVGVATGHPAALNGRTITTSALVWLDRRYRWARTRSRVYRLEGAGT
ncbi:MAG TPA: DUF6634 family protein [Vicinamibacterales bacterium]|jgi:hypothetical protein|nr:DUF6634 family protein [Vicinamibacterales bacterium]